MPIAFSIATSFQSMKAVDGRVYSRSSMKLTQIPAGAYFGSLA